MAEPALLTDRAVLAVSGPEAKDFLQGLITNDAGGAESGQAVYAALLTPQGKILFDFLLLLRDGVYLLDCALSLRDALQKRLTLYRLRAKVEIAPRDDLAVAWSLAAGALPDGFSDPRLAALGWRAFVPAGTAGGDATGAYRAHRVALGVPEGLDFGQDRMFALDADLEELHGVAFDKGCYVGQELTARMKHRGTARKRLVPVESIDGTALPPDAALKAGAQDLGTLASSYGVRGLAPIRLDRLAEAGDQPVTADGVAIRIIKPSWLFPSG